MSQTSQTLLPRPLGPEPLPLPAPAALAPAAAAQAQPQRQQDATVQRLEMLVAMFKARNMELLEENNRLRTELETNKQHLLLVQNGGSDAQLLTKILKEMTAMALGNNPAEPQAQVTIFAAGPAEDAAAAAAAGAAAASAAGAAPRSASAGAGTATEVKSKCAEFAMELEGMPKLPGAVVVETMGAPAGAQAAAPSGSALPDSIVPCLYSN